MSEQQADKMLFLSCLSQCVVDSLDEEIGEFRFKHKRVAKVFLEEHLKLMDKDFGSPIAVDQLVELSDWIRQVFEIMLKVGKRERIEQKCFQEDWILLLEKYKL